MPQTKRVWITPEADREMSRQGTRFVLRVVVLLAVVFLAVYLLYSYVPVPARYRVSINGVIAGLLFLPVMFWWRALFFALKGIGRKLMQERNWAAAVQALEPFTRFGNRSFDPDGEAHYLLASAYLALGQEANAERVAAFLRRFRAGSPYAERWKNEHPR